MTELILASVAIGIFIIYNIVMFVRMLMQWKMEKVASANNGAATVDEEEIKRRAIEEYIAEQNKKSENTGEENKGE